MGKRNYINSTHLEGYLYQADIEEKVTGATSKVPNTKYLRGKIEIATDEDLTNVVPVYFTYVTEVTSKGKTNSTFGTLLDIKNGVMPSIMGGASKETAAKFRIDSVIGLNEFYINENNEWKLVSQKRNDGGFIHTMTEPLNDDEKKRATFETDIVITKVYRTEENPEKQIPEKVIVKGAIFNFRKDLLPVEFSVLNPRAMDYFESLGATASTPVFTKIRGRQESSVSVKTIEEEGAFGETYVREVKSSRKDFVVTWALPAPYDWDDEATITASEFKEAIQNRETYLASRKQDAIEYAENKNKPAATTNSIANGGYDF